MNKEEAIQMAEDKAKEILIPAAKAYAKFLIKDIAMSALQDVVDSTENPYDNMLLAAVEPALDAKMAEFLDVPEA